MIGEVFAVPAAASVDSALDALLAAETDDRFGERLDALSGRFALLTLTEEGTRVFHDPIGSRSIFYLEGGGTCVGSHSELIARGFGLGPDPAARAIRASEEYRSRSVRYLPGDLTMYEGLRALAPNNYYDLDRGRTARYWPRQGRAPVGFERFFERLDEHMAALAGFLADRYEPILGITGGIDSRVMAAAFRRYQLGFEGVTWTGERGGHLGPEELASIDAVVVHLGAEHAFLRLGPLDAGGRRVARVAKRNAGNARRPSRVTAGMHERFAGGRHAFVRGYGAEVIRGFYNLIDRRSGRARLLDPPLLPRSVLTRARAVPGLAARLRRGPITAPTAAELLRAYDSSMRLPRGGGEHRRLGLGAFEGFIERANYDERVSGRGFDLNDVFYWEHRMGMWGSAMHNEMDAAVLSLAGFNSRPLYEAAFGLDPRERLTRELLREAIRRYDPALAAIPYS